MSVESDDEFEICSSQEPKKREFDLAPSDLTYKFKILQAEDDRRPHKIGYLLKEGVGLPYLAREVGGMYNSLLFYYVYLLFCKIYVLIVYICSIGYCLLFWSCSGIPIPRIVGRGCIKSRGRE